MSLIGQKYASLSIFWKKKSICIIHQLIFITEKDRNSSEPDSPDAEDSKNLRNFSYHKMGSLDKVKAAQIAQEKLDQLKEEEKKEQEAMEKRSMARAQKAKEILSKQYSLKHSTSTDDTKASHTQE